jgi:hypothetical protein
VRGARRRSGVDFGAVRGALVVEAAFAAAAWRLASAIFFARSFARRLVPALCRSISARAL